MRRDRLPARDPRTTCAPSRIAPHGLVPWVLLALACVGGSTRTPAPADSARTKPEAAVLTEVIVKLAPAAAAGEPARRAVDACAAKLGVTLTPLHPSTTDPELSTYFAAHVEAAAADRVVERLLACEGVEGAYRKPRGEPPRRR